MKRNYIILLAALLTVACAGNGDIMSPTPQEGEILFSGSTVGPKVRTSYEDTETALRVNCKPKFVPCPACGHRNKLVFKTCRKCGEPLSEEAKDAAVKDWKTKARTRDKSEERQ